MARAKDPILLDAVAFAMCREVNPCTSMAQEIMSQPDYHAGREGDASAMTLAGYFRNLAGAALRAVDDFHPDTKEPKA